MALVNPNIAMSFRQPEIQAPNALAQYAQLQQIQSGQQAQDLNRLQIQEYERARAEEEGTRNYLRGKDLTAPDTITGLSQFGKTGLAMAKSLQEQTAAALNAKNTQSQINERDFGLQKRKLDFAYSAIGSASTPEAAIAEVTKGAKDGVFDMKSATAEIQQLQKMTPEQYQQYRIQKVMGILEAKDKLGFMLPKTRDRDTGGVIQVIQDNPALPGYGLPMQGIAPVSKTKTFADITAEGQLKVARDRLAQEGQGVTYVQGADNTYVALPNKVRPGDVPTARPVIASGGGLRPLEGKPSDLVGKEQLSINQQKSIVQGAIDATKATPDAFGWTTGNMPEGLRARMASGEENENRAFVFNVVSGVIKERAGTAQTAGEAATLRRFLPDETDSATIIEEKLKGFQKYLDAREAGTTKKRGGGTPTPAKPSGSGVDTSNPLLN
jgi:hypothetical protein